MRHIEVTRIFDAPLQKVFDRYTDHASWTQWAGLGQVRLAAVGSPAPNGAGCVRVFRNLGRDVTTEEVVAFEPPHRMTYRLVGVSFPLRDHLGEVRFTPEGTGTRITWRCQFVSVVPGLGPVLAAGIGFIFRRVLAGLSRDLRA